MQNRKESDPTDVDLAVFVPLTSRPSQNLLSLISMTRQSLLVAEVNMVRHQQCPVPGNVRPRSVTCPGILGK